MLYNLCFDLFSSKYDEVTIKNIKKLNKEFFTEKIDVDAVIFLRHVLERLNDETDQKFTSKLNV